jgi:hypothetical protein
MNLCRIYYTTIKLGSPPRAFNVIVDFGSDVLWVHCMSCSQCGGSNFFDASKSSTAELVPCNHKMCTEKDCKGQCMYNITYADGSQTTGYYVSDQLSFDQIRGQSMIDNASSIIFG